MYVTQYSLLPSSLPIRPTHPASQVTESGLPTGGDKDTAIYTHTRLINESSATDSILGLHNGYNPYNHNLTDQFTLRNSNKNLSSNLSPSHSQTFLVIEMLKCDLFVAVHLVTDKTHSSDMYTYAL